MSQSNEVDPIRYEMFRHRLFNIAEEGRIAIQQVSGSPAVVEGGECMSLGDLSRTIASSRDPAELAELWLGWRRVSPPMRADFARFVELANEGARELGFADLGQLWRSRYDMSAEDIEVEVDRL